MKEADYLQTEQVHVFSNGESARRWEAHNCEQCKRAFRPAEGKDYPDMKTSIKLINLGMECKLKLALDIGWITSTMSLDICKQIGIVGEPIHQDNGLTFVRLQQQCRFFSDDDKDGWHPVYKPKEPPDNQMCLPFALNEICPETVKDPVCH